MSHPQYGRTWWGAQRLQALTQIDHDNRLPRGRSYANRGAVRDLVVAGSLVTARVQGSRPRPYDVEIGVPQVDNTLAGRLMDRLAEDPGLIARLLSRELDPALLEMAQQLKIPIFPARWSDLKMHCSCPDGAVPCKHLAAVIYLLSQQIDADPFLVFSLRGIEVKPGCFLSLLLNYGVLAAADVTGAECHPPLAGYVRAGAREPLSIELNELPAFLSEALPAIRAQVTGPAAAPAAGYEDQGHGRCVTVVPEG